MHFMAAVRYCNITDKEEAMNATAIALSPSSYSLVPLEALS